RGEVDVGPPGRTVVDTGPHADPPGRVEHDDLAAGPGTLPDGLAGDHVLLDGAGPLDLLLLRQDERGDLRHVRLLGSAARPSRGQPLGGDRQEAGRWVGLRHRTSFRLRGRYSGGRPWLLAARARWTFVPKRSPSCSTRSRTKVARGPRCHVSSKSRLALAKASGERSD